MPIHIGRLLLTARDPFQPPPAGLPAALAAAGFLGAPLPDRAGTYLVGDRFLQLVVFAGCSVRIAFSPDDAPFCHIGIRGPYPSPRLLYGRNTRPPRCPGCRSPLLDWKGRLAAREAGRQAVISCPACGAAQPPWGWDWKENAGWGRLFIGIEEVFPGEAVPAPTLMALLARVTGGEWRHFYAQDA